MSSTMIKVAVATVATSLAAVGVVACARRDDRADDTRWTATVDPPGAWNSLPAAGSERRDGSEAGSIDPRGPLNRTDFVVRRTSDGFDGRIDPPGVGDDISVSLERHADGSWSGVLDARGWGGRSSITLRAHEGGYVGRIDRFGPLNHAELSVVSSGNGWTASFDPVGPWNTTQVTGRGRASLGVHTALFGAIQAMRAAESEDAA